MKTLKNDTHLQAKIQNKSCFQSVLCKQQEIQLKYIYYYYYNEKPLKRVSRTQLDFAKQIVCIPNKLREYDAHIDIFKLQKYKIINYKKRLQQNYKLSPPKDQRIYEQVKKTQFISNRKRELMKWQTIQEQNTQILARLAKISNRSPTPPSQCGTPRGRRQLKEQKLRIESENKRMLNKLNGIQSNLKQENFQDSYSNFDQFYDDIHQVLYLKHKKIQNNMQKFYFDQNLQKIKLRVDSYLDNLNIQKLNERSKSLHINPRNSKLN